MFVVVVVAVAVDVVAVEVDCLFQCLLLNVGVSLVVFLGSFYPYLFLFVAPLSHWSHCSKAAQ